MEKCLPIAETSFFSLPAMANMHSVLDLYPEGQKWLLKIISIWFRFIKRMAIQKWIVEICELILRHMIRYISVELGRVVIFLEKRLILERL